uniref:Uncharacterized protein n=2 Tax=Zea mays TaxID=4577 RepID=C0PH31_MAIZE|nr:unknown [Zea mays]|eukprot:NP_001169680.1 uncharacterized protein LOC100383561 [Zea mays]
MSQTFFTLNALKDISHIFIFQQMKFLFSILIIFRLRSMNSTNSPTVDHFKIELIRVPECRLFLQFLQPASLLGIQLNSLDASTKSAYLQPASLLGAGDRGARALGTRRLGGGGRAPMAGGLELGH